MLSCCCCSYLTCADVWREMRKSIPADEDQSSRSIRMDVALLKEQYNSVKDKQRRETPVVCFKRAVNNEEICGTNLLGTVPVSQAKPALSDASVLQTQFDCVEGSDSGPWRTHLDVYRLTRADSGTERVNPTSDCSDVTDDAASTDSSSRGSSEDLGSQHSDTCHHLQNNLPVTCSALNTRKSSSPAVLSRQLSFGCYRSCPSPAGSQYYPFPQVKGLKKSDTARRLGLYSSF